MDALLKIVAALGGINATRRSDALREYAIVTVCGFLAGIAGIAAAGFGLSSLWLAVLPRFGETGAALIIAGTLAALCLVFAAAAVTVVRRRRQPPVRYEADAVSALTAASHLFFENKTSLLLAALIAGVTVGSGGGKAARPTNGD